MKSVSEDDTAFLADVARFLADYTTPGSPLAAHLKPAPLPASNDSGLLLATTHQLLAETETLLSSLTTASDSQVQEQQAPNKQKNSVKTAKNRHKITSKDAKTELNSEDQRRELRNAQAAKRRLRYRQKLKDEKETLEQEQVELSSTLHRLQQARAADAANAADRTALSVWRAVATRQKEKRQEAEQQQRQLRAAVIGRARMIHHMNALLQRPHSAEEDKGKLCNGTASSNVQEKDGSVLFKAFIDELDAIYEQTDQVMHEAEFKMASTLQYKPKRTWKQGVQFFVSADMTVIPFGFEQTSRAVSLLMMTDPSTSSCSDDVQVPQNTVTARYQLKCQLEPGETSKLSSYAAVRRINEAGRMVFVWRSLTEGQDELSGYVTDETGWFVLRPHPSNTSSTILEAYVRFVPMSVGDAADSAADTDRFAQLVAKTGEEEVSEMMRMLEKMLVGVEKKP